MSVDFSELNGEISDLTADVAQLKEDVAYLSGEVSSTQEALDGVASTLNTVSSDYVTATGFAALSNEIGLSAASSSNPVVTKNDIADLAGAMHFRGPVTPTDGQTDISAIEDYYDNEGLSPESAVTSANAYTDEAIGNAIDDLSIGDYATKAEVSTVSVELTGMVNSTNEALASVAETLGTVSSDYLTSSDKTDLEGAIAETSAAAITSAVTSANAYTDEAIAGLSIGNYYTKSETSSANEISVALAGKNKT